MCTVCYGGGQGLQPLFNGKDLTGWQGMGGPMTNWEIKDGVLSCTGKAGSAWLATKEEFANFELQLEYNIPRTATAACSSRAQDRCAVGGRAGDSGA